MALESFVLASGSECRIHDMKIANSVSATRTVIMSGANSMLTSSRLEGGIQAVAHVSLAAFGATAMGNEIYGGNASVEIATNGATSVGNALANVNQYYYRVVAGSGAQSIMSDVYFGVPKVNFFQYVGGVHPRVGFDALLNVDITEAEKVGDAVVFWDQAAKRYRLGASADLATIRRLGASEGNHSSSGDGTLSSTP